MRGAGAGGCGSDGGRFGGEGAGGADKIKAIQRQKITGKISFGPGADGPFEVEFERPGKMHMEITVGGQTMVRVYDGKSAGWVINPFSPNKDVQPMEADELRGISDESDFDGPLMDYQSKGNQIELAGKDEVNGKAVVKLKLTNKHGDVPAGQVGRQAQNSDAGSSGGNFF